MTTTQHSYVEQPATGSTNLQSASYKFTLILIGVAFCIDLLTPFLISNSILPGAVRWLSDLLLLSIIGVALFQMLLQDRIPGAVLLIAAITIVGCVVSIYSDQVWLATAWGWWRLFKFPDHHDLCLYPAVLASPLCGTLVAHLRGNTDN